MALTARETGYWVRIAVLAGESYGTISDLYVPIYNAIKVIRLLHDAMEVLLHLPKD